MSTFFDFKSAQSPIEALVVVESIRAQLHQTCRLFSRSGTSAGPLARRFVVSVSQLRSFLNASSDGDCTPGKAYETSISIAFVCKLSAAPARSVTVASVSASASASASVSALRLHPRRCRPPHPARLLSPPPRSPNPPYLYDVHLSYPSPVMWPVMFRLRRP